MDVFGRLGAVDVRAAILAGGRAGGARRRRARALARALGAADGGGAALVGGGARPLAHALEGVEVALGQHLARGLAQAHREVGEEQQADVEEDADHEDDLARHDADVGLAQEVVEVGRGVRVHVDLQVPRRRQQHEHPEVVAAEPAPQRLGLAHVEARLLQVGVEHLRPRVVAGRVGREHLHEEAGLQHAHAPRPDFVVAVAPRLHEEEEADEHRVDEDDEVRVGREREGERERRAGGDDGPVGRRVEPVAPGVGARHLAAVEVHHRRVELGGRGPARRRRGGGRARELRGVQRLLGRDGLVDGRRLGRVRDGRARGLG